LGWRGGSWPCFSLDEGIPELKEDCVDAERSEEELDDVLDQVYDWGVAFSQSKRYEELTEEQKSESYAVVMSFADHSYSQLGLRPEEWSVTGLDACCMDILPRTLCAGESFFRSVAPVLSAFFTYLAERRLLRNASRLARKVARIDKQIVRAASDPRNWGVAKTVAMVAMEAGVDVTDEHEMNAFITSLNPKQALELPSDGELKFEHRAVGNDPCPCGSGKKYINCCGQRKG
jgi:hypothetical protein